MVHEIALTIKPTMNCNMKCKHCFNGDIRYDSNMLDLQSIYYFIEAACKEYQDVKVTFHGGEPTLAGFDYYNRVFEFENVMSKKYNVTFSNNFTTNGLLLTDELIELLVDNNTLINVSFDGPYNDVLRGNSDEVYRRICVAKDKGGRVRAFCSISRGSFENLLEVYKWFNEREIDFKILPIEPRGYAAVDRKYLMDPVKFVDVLSNTYKYWCKDKKCKVRVFTFEEFASLRRSRQFKPFWFRREIALNPDGKIYPFGRPNDLQFCLGESDEDLVLGKCFESVQYEKMLGLLDDIRKNYCTSCSAANVCNGVCVCMSYMYVQDRELLEYSCNQSRLIFESVLKINDMIQSDIDNGKIGKYNNVVRTIFTE